jgi:NADH-quinone oxidoreductase subunit M
MGVPGTSGFIAEFMTFLGSFQSDVLYVKIFTVISILGILMGAGYILWLLQRVFYGPPQDKFNHVHDADKMEMVYSAIFIVLIFAIGLNPSLLTNIIKTGISPIIHLVGG